MRFILSAPFHTAPPNPAFLTGDAIAGLARAAEDAGFWGVAFTEHPAPPEAWRATGGHDALDPFVALTWAAAVTTRLRLLTNLTVLPYRNPFLLAKTSATLDRLSGGRLVLGAGVGYLEGEYEALGVPSPSATPASTRRCVCYRSPGPARSCPPRGPRSVPSRSGRCPRRCSNRTRPSGWAATAR